VAAGPTPSPDRYLEVDGARLRYRDSGSGPAVVLVHGWTLDLEMWNPQVERLADRFRLVRLDRRGHGLSAGSPRQDQDAADLTALCRSLGLTCVALVGMSQGTRSALAFAGAAPEIVRALVLDGTPDLQAGAAQSDLPLAHFRTLLRTQGIAAFRREWRLQDVMQLKTADRSMHELLHEMLQRYDGRDLLDTAAATTNGTTAVRLNSITAPALILNGEFDLDTRAAAADYLCRQLPQAERCLVARAGHLANLDNPEDYADLCRTFLSRQLVGSAWR
jgi:pimeloyl-ACP methyl ester carboxylesterase